MRIPLPPPSPITDWRPDYARTSATPPKAGDYIAYRHAVWKVIEVNPVPEVDWTDQERAAVAGIKPTHRSQVIPTRAIVRPAQTQADDPRDRDRDLHLRTQPGRNVWHIYPDEHYPTCAQCGEPTPCRDRIGQRQADLDLQRIARYETPGVCPACREPITTRQKRVTFSDNLEIPAGPPVTYHAGRGRCRYGASEYERRWVAADPKRRRTTLSCPGHLTTHNDGTYDCTELAECRGPMAHHHSYSVCR